jgi:hypothetical protein
MVLLSPINEVVRVFPGGELPAGFIHDVVRSACKKGFILAIFSIPAILVIQLRLCVDWSTLQFGVNTKYGTALVLGLVPLLVVLVVVGVVNVWVVSEALAVVVGEVMLETEEAIGFRTVNNILECFTCVTVSVDEGLEIELELTQDILAVTLFEPSLSSGGLRE